MIKNSSEMSEMTNSVDLYVVSKYPKNCFSINMYLICLRKTRNTWICKTQNKPTKSGLRSSNSCGYYGYDFSNFM